MGKKKQGKRASDYLAVTQMFKAKDMLDNIAKEKRRALREKQGLTRERVMWKTIFFNWWGPFRNKILLTFCPCTIYDRKRHFKSLRPPATFTGRLFHDQTYENQVLKSCLGFVGGLLLSLLWLALMVYYMGYSYQTATITCAIISAVLSLGLAFSNTVRCLTFLSLPQLCTSKGRAVLVAVCFVLVLNGPTHNFRYNVHVLSNTVTCGQQMAANMTQQVVDSALAPVKNIIGSIRSVLQALTKLAEQLRNAVMKIRNLFLEIVHAVKRVFNWLSDMVGLCNDKMGAPYNKCAAGFNAAIDDCKRKLGPLGFACQVVHAVSWVCEIAKIAGILCSIPASVQQDLVDHVTSGMKFALKDVYDMFYFKVNLTYQYDIRLEQSKTYEEVRQDIQDDIEARIQPLLKVTSLSNVGLVLMFAMLIFKAYQYRRKYLTRDKHDNYYITWHIRDIDKRRETMEEETILPLNCEEKGKYIETMSKKIVKGERRKLIRGMFLLGVSGLHMGFQLCCDAGLWWLLDMIRSHGELITSAATPGRVKMHVDGKGVLPDIYRAMITEFDPMTAESVSIDTRPCLPRPSRPDFSIYVRVGYIFGTCILLQLLQSYILRLRHIVAGCYHPEREKARAVWLYNHILKKRGSFLFALRQRVRAKSKTEKAEASADLFSTTVATLPVLGKLLKLFGVAKYINCLSCNKAGSPGNREEFVYCDNPHCNAVYCDLCYDDLNNLCAACLNPVQYGAFSDISEEKDSSDEIRRPNQAARAAMRGTRTRGPGDRGMRGRGAHGGLMRGRGRGFGGTPEPLNGETSLPAPPSGESSDSSSATESDPEEYNYQNTKNLDQPCSSSSSEDERRRRQLRYDVMQKRPFNMVSTNVFKDSSDSSSTAESNPEDYNNQTTMDLDRPSSLSSLEDEWRHRQLRHDVMPKGPVNMVSTSVLKKNPSITETQPPLAPQCPKSGESRPPFSPQSSKHCTSRPPFARPIPKCSVYQPQFAHQRPNLGTSQPPFAPRLPKRGTFRPHFAARSPKPGPSRPQFAPQLAKPGASRPPFAPQPKNLSTCRPAFAHRSPKRSASRPPFPHKPAKHLPFQPPFAPQPQNLRTSRPPIALPSPNPGTSLPLFVPQRTKPSASRPSNPDAFQPPFVPQSQNADASWLLFAPRSPNVGTSQPPFTPQPAKPGCSEPPKCGVSELPFALQLPKPGASRP